MSGKGDVFLDAASLTIWTLTSASTRVGHKVVSLVAISKKRVVKRSTYYQARLIVGDAQRERKKSRVRHVMTPRFFGAPKSCAFGKTLKMCAIDSTP